MPEQLSPALIKIGQTRLLIPQQGVVRIDLLSELDSAAELPPGALGRLGRRDESISEERRPALFATDQALRLVSALHPFHHYGLILAHGDSELALAVTELQLLDQLPTQIIPLPPSMYPERASEPALVKQLALLEGEIISMSDAAALIAYLQRTVEVLS